MSNNNSADLISIIDVAKKLPKISRKAPTMLKGLTIAYNKNPKKNVGLGWAFQKAVKTNPNGVALAFEDKEWTYQQMNEWANKLAHYFLSLGVKKGDVVAAYIENRPELLCLSIAMAKIGAITALVNTSQTHKVLVHSINLVEAKYIVVGEELFDNLNEVIDDVNVPKTNLFWWADDTDNQAPKGYQNIESQIQNQPNNNPKEGKQVFKDDGLFYIYTSGTTGLPKAVIFNHGRWMKAYGTFGHIANLNKNDTMYVTLPMYHATGIAVCWSTVVKGAATLALRRKFSASNFWKDIHKYNASSFGYVGELCRYLMDVPQSSLDKSHRVTKMIGNGMRPNIWHGFKDRFDVDEVFEFYASSEGNIGFSNIFNFENTVGFSPMPYSLVKYDKEKNEPIRNKKGHCIQVKKGEVGLLVGEITAKTPFDGYSDPEKNRAVILTDVFKSGDKFFNTGDLMRNIGFKHAQFVDRVGDTFRWKGENVSTTEVENIISELDGVSEAIVYGVEIEGTNGRAGMVAVKAIDGKQLCEKSCTALIPQIQEALPPYAVPVFVRILQEVEQTGTFKYSKNKLKETAFNPEKTTDKILVCLPSETEFRVVDKSLFDQIQSQTFRF